jgi:serine/threonine-protein kinase
MPVPRIIGRYAMYGEIAAGGMATVHLGRLVGSGGVHRLVAIKRLHAQFAKDPEFVTMFLDEGRLASRIHHPNVVSPLDFVSLEGELFLVMEYVQGESLSSLIRAAGKRREHIPTRIAASFVIGLLEGLHAAHIATSERGEPLQIVHRDVSPQNVLVSVDGIARVLDFGVAKAVGRLQTTREGQIKGKIAYMAPEQLRSEPVDHRADVYAVGVVLWELLAGKRLFHGESEGAVLTKILLGTVDPPSTCTPGLSPGWDAITMKALSVDPTQRYAIAAEMAEAIEGVSEVATARAVGQWMSGLLGESLAKRATIVRAIEQSTDLDGDATRESMVLVEALRTAATGASNATGAAFGVTQPAAPEPSTGASALTAAPPPSKSRTPLVLALGASLLALVASAALLSRGHAQADAAPAAASGAPSTGAPRPPETATAVVVASALPSPDAIAVTATASAPVATSAPVTTSTPVAAKPGAAHPVVTGVAPATKSTGKPAAKSANCANPFVVDANGDTHVKRECL